VTSQREPNLRLFVALELSREWLATLERAQSDLRQALEALGGRGLRNVRPEGIHLTLKFLGGVPESRLDSVRNALRSATSDYRPISLTMGRLGSFGDRRGPRVAWVGLDGATLADRERLYRLVESIETWLEAAGFAREGRFQPHLTLARVPEDFSRDDRALVARACERVRVREPAPLTAPAVSLMQSHLGPGGTRYERLAAFPEA
jgi:2'-5' RNA ligase